MQYAYDSYNRIQRITYPDGEVVSYEYNKGGMLNKVFGSVTRNIWEMVEPVQIQGGLTAYNAPRISNSKSRPTEHKTGNHPQMSSVPICGFRRLTVFVEGWCVSGAKCPTTRTGAAPWAKRPLDGSRPPGPPARHCGCRRPTQCRDAHRRGRNPGPPECAGNSPCATR